MAKRKKVRTNLYPGPTYEDDASPTGYSRDLFDLNVASEHSAWEEAWAEHVKAHPTLPIGNGPADLTPLPGRGGSTSTRYSIESDPVRKARFVEAVDYIANYVGTWEFIKNLRAHEAWGTKWFRLSDRQVEVVLNSKARDLAFTKERAERKANGLDLSSLPEGTTRYAVENGEGNLTFMRVDRVMDGKWAGWVFVKQVIGGGMPGYNVEEKLGAQRPGDAYKGSFESLLRKVVADPVTAAIRYGMELGECSRCGRTLTNAESREAGLGPECQKAWKEAA